MVGMPTDSSASPTLEEAVRCPLLEGRHEEWIRCCTARFLPLARRIAGNDQCAEDALQETWIIALHKIHQYRGPPPACGWIRTIVKHEVQHAAVRHGRGLSFSDPADGGEAPAPNPGRMPPGDTQMVDSLCQRQMMRVLLEIIDHLPPLYREVVQLRDIEGRPGAEVSRLLHLSKSGVRSRLHRAHRLVRRQLHQYLNPPRH